MRWPLSSNGLPIELATPSPLQVNFVESAHAAGIETAAAFF
jgi:hypothetical protein